MYIVIYLALRKPPSSCSCHICVLILVFPRHVSPNNAQVWIIRWDLRLSCRQVWTCSVVEVHRRFWGGCCLPPLSAWSEDGASSISETPINFYETLRSNNSAESNLHELFNPKIQFRILFSSTNKKSGYHANPKTTKARAHARTQVNSYNWLFKFVVFTFSAKFAVNSCRM